MIYEFLLNVYFTGTAGDSLSFNNGMKFSTQDVDNDRSSLNCAQIWLSAWWFTRCSDAHLNGEYKRGRHTKIYHGIMWRDFKGVYYSYKVSEMKIAPNQN